MEGDEVSAPGDASMGAYFWRTAGDWLLHELDAYLDDGDVYRLWVFAEENDPRRLCDYLKISSSHAPLSQARGWHLAMAYGCWTAVCRFSMASDLPRPRTEAIDHVLREIQRLVPGLRHHPTRETAMRSAAGVEQVPRFVVYLAVRHGNLESVIWLHQVARYDPSEALDIAARHGHGRVVAWLLENAPTAHLANTNGLLLRGVDAPELGVFAWTSVQRGSSHRYVFTEKWGVAGPRFDGVSDHQVIDLAARQGDLDGIQRLLALPTFQWAYSYRAADDAAAFGHLHVLQWLHEHLPEVFIGAKPLTSAAFNGQLRVAQWVMKHVPADEDVPRMLDLVVANGHLHVLQWMAEQFPAAFTLEACSSLIGTACRSGHLAIIQWFEGRGHSMVTLDRRDVATQRRCMQSSFISHQPVTVSSSSSLSVWTRSRSTMEGDEVSAPGDASMGAYFWRTAGDWLLHELDAYLDDGDVYRLWVFAEENDPRRLCDYLKISSSHAPLSQARGWHLAMAYGCWTAVCRFSMASDLPRPRTEAIDHVLREIQRLVPGLRHHPARETAMRSAAGVEQVPRFVVYLAVRHGNLESVIWLHQVARYDPSEALDIAARHGHGRVVAWLLENAPTAHLANTNGLLLRGVDAPELGVFAWTSVQRGSSHRYVFTEKWGVAGPRFDGVSDHQVIDLAARQGDLDGIQRLLALPTFQWAYSYRAADDAAAFGHLHVLQWLHEHLPEVFIGAKPLTSAAFNGQLRVAQWVMKHVPADEDVPRMLDLVVANGHLHVLQWMAEQFPAAFTLEACSSLIGTACRSGHLAIIQWFEGRGHSMVTLDRLDAAARKGRFDVMMWLFQRSGDPQQRAAVWGSLELDSAVDGGSLDLVRWFVEEQHVWSWSSLLLAATHDNTAIIDFLYSYALEHGKALPDFGQVRYDPSDHRDNFSTLTWLLAKELAPRRFVRDMFNHFKQVEDMFEKHVEQLGWSDDADTRIRWPQTYATMARLRSVIQLAIDVVKPGFLRREPWLPQWAVRHGTMSNLQRLELIEHAEIDSDETFRVLLRTSTDTEKVKWFLQCSPESFSTHVVQWAVKFDKRVFLQWLQSTFLPAAGVSDVKLLQQCLHTAFETAHKYKRADMLLWMSTFAEDPTGNGS